MKRRPVGLHEPVFAGNEWRYLKECLDTGWVSTAGRFVERFEEMTARRLGCRRAVAVVNGTAGLHLALRLVGVEAGDEVLVPSLTFIATANSVVYLGASPRFLDVEEATFGLDPEKLEAFLSKRCVRRRGALRARDTGARIAACMPMHALGHPARIDRVAAICRRYSLPLVEDAAEALGTSYRGRTAGTFGRLGVLSFNGNKIVTTGGGGMIVTDDERLADRAKHLSTQAKSDSAAFWHDDVGYNYRLPNLNAAVGCAQLERLDGMLKEKRRLAGRYRDALAGAAGLRLVWEPEGARSNFWLNTVVCEEPARARRALAALNEAGFGARPLWAPAHLQKPLKKYPRESLDVTERLWRTSFNIPSSVGVSPKDADAVVRAVLGA